MESIVFSSIDSPTIKIHPAISEAVISEAVISEAIISEAIINELTS